MTDTTQTDDLEEVPPPPEQGKGGGGGGRQRRQGARYRVHEIMESGRSSGPLGIAFEAFLILLIVANVAAVTVETVPPIGATYHKWFGYFEIFSVVIFTIEYALRLWTAPEDPRFADNPVRGRLRFALQPYMMIDLLAFAPAYIALFMPVADFRILRMFRLLRLLKMARYSPAVSTLVHVLSQERRALFGTLLLLLCVMCMSAEFMYVVEGHVQPTVFGTLPDCMYWAIVTLTTVGYGDKVPITELGRLIAGITMIFGLGLFALPVGIISASFLSEIRRRDFVVTWNMISQIPLFQGFEVAALNELITMLRSYLIDEGAPVVVAGEPAEAMYFIVSGQAMLESVERKIKLGPGNFFGEDALLQSRPHDTSVIAHSSLRLLALPAQDFSVLMRRHPAIRRRLERLSARKQEKIHARRQKRPQPKETA
ncbi:MAG TPA: cyclic nucleotide-gated ion channel [Rhizomicrobium sp.]